MAKTAKSGFSMARLKARGRLALTELSSRALTVERILEFEKFGSSGVVCVILRLAILIPACDTQTDRQTDRQKTHTPTPTPT